MTAYTARALSTDRLQSIVTQNTHGFVVGHVVSRNLNAPGASWKLAKADSLVDCQGSCMVSFVIDVNNFVVTQEGHISNFDASLGGVIDATQYWLSPSTAGHITSTMPTSAGQILLPCFVADSTTSGYFFGGSGNLIESSGIFKWNIVGVGPTTMAVNNGYMSSSGGTAVLNLPTATPVVIGDTFKVTNLVGQFSIHIGAGQSVNFGNDVLNTSITSMNVGDFVELVCYNGGTGSGVAYQVTDSMGNLTIV